MDFVWLFVSAGFVQSCSSVSRQQEIDQLVHDELSLHIWQLKS